MQQPFKIVLSLMSLFLALSPFSLPGQFTVTRVYDGDTVVAQGHDIVIYVLLAGIDATELPS
jgi:endonuclease YncB( thermonuclease family)